MCRKELIMSEQKTKKFNLLKYVYGRLFAEQFLGKNAEGLLIEDTSKIYSWQGILYWMKKEGYKKSVLAFKFNRQKTMYDYYIKAIERNLNKNSINIIPMGELIEQKAYDDFEAQYNMPVEYIERADRCLADLNKQIAEEFEKQRKEQKEETKAA